MKTYPKLLSMLIALALMIGACDPFEDDKPMLGPAPTSADVTFTATPTAENPNIIRFVNTSPGFKFLWDFGNGTSGEGPEVMGEFPLQGQYTVTLTIFTRGGQASNSQVVNIAETNPLMLDREDYNLLSGGANQLEGKIWMVDRTMGGHLGVGPVEGNFPEWYQAAPNEKAGEGFYDDELTFKLDGFTYIYDNKGGTFANGAHVADLGGTPTGSDATVAYTPGSNLRWSIVEEGNRKFIQISNGGFMSYYTGVSRFEIMLLTENELHIRQLDSKNGALAWYQKFIRKGYERPLPEIPYKSEDIFENFDGQSNITWGIDQIGFFGAYDNPATFGINTSARVGRYVKTSAPFDNVYINLPYKIDLRERHVFKMKVFLPGYNDYETAAGEGWNPNPRLLKQVALKLQNAESGTPWETQAEIIVPVAQMDNWVEVTFDFSAFSERTDFNRIVLQIGGEAHYIPGTFFVDDFRLE